MTEKAKPVSFAKHFKLDKEKLSELGTFNPVLNFDTKLFVEPLLLKKSSSPIIQASFKTYNEFFRKLLMLIKASKEPDDICWRQAKRLISFPEYKSTCIGYGSDSINGSGSGSNLNERILQSAKDIVEAAQDNPEIFLLLPLLEEGIGADIVSDMTQTIIDDDICKYTVDAMEKLGVKGTKPYTTKQRTTYMLAYNPYHKCPVKLLPSDILSNLPMADDFDDWITKIAGINSDLRDGINQHIGETWFKENKVKKKEEILELIKSDKDFFFVVLKTLQETSLDHYDIEQDWQGLRRWLEDSKKFITPENFNKIQSVEEKQEALFEAVAEVITQFKDLIECEELWRIFWTQQGSELKHVNELYSQMLFYMVSNTWLAAQDSNVSVDRYLNKETQQINYIFSISKKCKVVVQVKHSDNFSGLEKIYDKQHSLYNEGKAPRSFYVVMNFDDKQSNQLTHILEKEEPDCKVVVIHACSEDSQQSLFDHDTKPDWFDGLESPESVYAAEKRKSGENSYQVYKPLRDKVEELCKAELAINRYSSANQLCNKVANIIEEEHQSLLDPFEPYQICEYEGNDWKKPTFYGWCNKYYKAHKPAKETELA
ncbi:MAG: hypothetical protein PQ612_10785 [Rickettsiales bacterium]|nr:hypothetical protein [Pseudomonadota bacterium]MDA0966707.1 hypothetical protein [Pseudomonadota bacterium]MDG4544482.1 hypothetical protein [Rickettsiales bacterium]MDG4546634.1 hypothetical protein [Rickettsiales bacterium]MDG4548781.1 hypothetical protein [Rickettsiales bacterium]